MLTSKTDLLQSITNSANNRTLSLEEITQAYNQGLSTNPKAEQLQAKPSSRFSLPKILAFIGGLVLLIGITIVIAVNWKDFSNSVQILVTLGLGLLFFVVANIGFAFSKQLQKLDFAGNIAHLLASFLLPLGVFVFLSKLPPSNINPALISGWVFLGLGLLYFLSDLVFKKGILVLIATGFASISYASFYELIQSNRGNYHDRLSSWATLVLAVTYLLLAFVTWNTKRRWASHLALLGGTILFLVSIFGIIYFSEAVNYSNYSGGAASSQITDTVQIPEMGSKVLEYLFGFVILPFYYLGARIESKWLVSIATISTITWILYLNSKYFFGKIDFGLNLIISGILIIIISLSSLRFNQFLKKLLSKKPSPKQD